MTDQDAKHYFKADSQDKWHDCRMSSKKYNIISFFDNRVYLRRINAAVEDLQVHDQQELINQTDSASFRKEIYELYNQQNRKE